MVMGRISILNSIVGGIILLIGITTLCIYFSQFHDGFADQTIFGSFGDYIGGVLGTLLSLISVVYIFLTYRKQIEFSEKQEKLALTQQFESTFFNLLQNQRSILMSLRLNNNTIDYAYMKKVANELKKRLSEREYGLTEITLENKENEQEKINDIYQGIYLKYGSELGHYFRSLYHIFKYIGESAIVPKSKYYGLIQAQMNNDELYLLFYNSISSYGKKKMYPFVENNNLLENLRYTDFLYFKKHQEIFYPETNFKIDE